MPYETDERLKSYLDTNQLQREQMCLAVLAIDRRFTDVRPRHPRGGPDGGRDIEALFQDGQRAFGAVGFVNQASDSDQQRNQIKKKFRGDLERALEGDSKPDVFVFFTNVNLTIKDKKGLTSIAKKSGCTHCEVFDRERIRIALDNPDGFATRFQHLDMPLSEPEQSSFFARWGDDIQAVISTGFQEVQSTLDRLLFLEESASTLTHLTIRFELDRTYAAEEIGHFRAFCALHLKEPTCNTMSILFGSSDISRRMYPDGPGSDREQLPGIAHGISGGQWEERITEDTAVSEDDSREKYALVTYSSSVGMDELSAVVITYSRHDLIRTRPVLALRDYDESMFLPMLNDSLARKIRNVRVFANDYKLLDVSREDIHIDDQPFEPIIPVEFSEHELTDRWVRIRPVMSSAFHLRFSRETPRRIFAPRQVKR